MGALRTLRSHSAFGLVLVMFMLTGHCSQSAPSPAPAVDVQVDVDVEGGVEVKQDARRMVELVKHVENSRGNHGVKTPAQEKTVEESKLRTAKTDTRTQEAVVFTIDLRKKEKFLEHITGPLYFSPKCRKNVYRLYHHTRDCTVPAYFKRCAQLLIRLAGSPQCTEG